MIVAGIGMRQCNFLDSALIGMLVIWWISYHVIVEKMYLFVLLIVTVIEIGKLSL